MGWGGVNWGCRCWGGRCSIWSHPPNCNETGDAKGYVGLAASDAYRQALAYRAADRITKRVNARQLQEYAVRSENVTSFFAIRVPYGVNLVRSVGIPGANGS